MGIGQSITTEEECNRCSTPPVTRILSKKLDPRSPTEGILRTPIEIVCTPKIKNVDDPTASSTCDTPKTVKHNQSENKLNKKVDLNFDEWETRVTNQLLAGANESVKNIEENNTNFIINNQNEIVREEVFCNANNSIEELQNIKPDSMENNDLSFEKKMYLETDIDAVNDDFINNLHIQHPRVKQLKKIKDLSSTSADNSTSNENFAKRELSNSTSTNVSSLMDESIGDPSIIVSDIEDVLSNTMSQRPAIQDWLITIEDNCESFTPFDIPADDNNDKSNELENREKTSNSLIDVSKNTYVTTPDLKKNRSSNERTPLSCLMQNKVFEPLKECNNHKKKQWRGIQEERARRGLSLSDENTPPLPPPMDRVSSAPGKLIRRRNIVDWDEDNVTLFI